MVSYAMEDQQIWLYIVNNIWAATCELCSVSQKFLSPVVVCVSPLGWLRVGPEHETTNHFLGNSRSNKKVSQTKEITRVQLFCLKKKNKSRTIYGRLIESV